MNVGAVSRFVLAHKKIVVISWVIIFIVAVAPWVNRSTRFRRISASRDERARKPTKRSWQRTGTADPTSPMVPVVTLPEGTTVDSPGVKAELASLFANLQSVAPAARMASFATTDDPVFVSNDGRTTFGLIFVPTGSGISSAPEVDAITSALTGATMPVPRSS